MILVIIIVSILLILLIAYIIISKYIKYTVNSKKTIDTYDDNKKTTDTYDDTINKIQEAIDSIIENNKYLQFHDCTKISRLDFVKHKMTSDYFEFGAVNSISEYLDQLVSFKKWVKEQEQKSNKVKEKFNNIMES